MLNGPGYGSAYFQVTLHCDLCFLRTQLTGWRKRDAADSDKSRFTGLTCYYMLQLSLKCHSSISDLSWGSVRCSQKEAPVSVWCLPLSSCLPPVRLCPVESHTHESSANSHCENGHAQDLLHPLKATARSFAPGTLFFPGFSPWNPRIESL